MPRRRGMYSQEGINMARPSDGRWQRGHGVEQDWLPKRTLVGSNVAVLQTQIRSVSQGRGKGKLRYEGPASQTRALLRGQAGAAACCCGFCAASTRGQTVLKSSFLCLSSYHP